MARELTAGEIEGLASRDNVKRIAVENFLGTVTVNPDRGAAVGNAFADAEAYGWNRATLQAILTGIDLAFFGEGR
jgi:hypothetical protein